MSNKDVKDCKDRKDKLQDVAARHVSLKSLLSLQSFGSLSWCEFGGPFSHPVGARGGGPFRTQPAGLG